MPGIVTNIGLKATVDALIKDGTVKHIGWGGGSGRNETATGLAAPFAEGRTAGTLAATTTVSAGDTLRVTGTIVATAKRSVTEVGVFSSSTGGTMVIYGSFPAVSLAVGDSIAFTVDAVVDQK